MLLTAVRTAVEGKATIQVKLQHLKSVQHHQCLVRLCKLM